MAMSQHSAQQTQLVADTNRGLAGGNQQQATSSVGQSASMSGYQDPNAGIASAAETGLTTMMGIADPTIQRKAEEDVDNRMTEAYNTPKAQEAYKLARDEQSELSKNLWGASPEVRGLQERVAKDTVNTMYTQTLADVKGGKYNDYTEEAFVDAMTYQLNDSLDAHEGDADMQKIITDAHMENMGRVSPYQTVGHEAWKQETAQALFKGASFDAGKALKMYPDDPDMMIDYLSSLEQQDGQTDSAWDVAATESISGSILDGTPGIYEAVQLNGQYDKLSPDGKAKVDDANAMHRMNQTTEGLQHKINLEKAMNSGDIGAIEQSADAMNAIKPGSVDKHQAIMNGMATQATLREKAEVEQNVGNDALQGLATSSESMDALFTTEATAYRNNKINGMDIPEQAKEQLLSNDVSEADLTQYMLENPDDVAYHLRRNQGVSSPVVKRALNNGIADMTSTSKINPDTQDGQKRIASIQASSNLYQAISKDNPEAAKYLAGSQDTELLLKDVGDAVRAGQDLSVAMADIHANRERDWEPLDMSSEDYEAAIDKGMQSMISEHGEGWFNTPFFKSLNNEAQVKAEYQKAYQAAYENGGPTNVEAKAWHLMKNSTATIGGNAHLGLGDANEKIGNVAQGGSIDGWLNTVSKDPAGERLLKENGWTSWDDPDINYTVRGNELLVELPAKKQTLFENIFNRPGSKTDTQAYPTTIPLQLPDTEEAYRNLNSDDLAKWKRSYRPSAIITEQYGTPEQQIQ